MRSLRVLLGVCVALAAAIAAPALAQEPGDSATSVVDELFIGQRATLELAVRAPVDATVEVDPASISWNGVEVVRVVSLGPTPDGDEAIFRFEVVVAPFLPGPGSFEPSVAIVTQEGATIRTLPAISWNVRPTLPADAPLDLSPLPEPGTIAGAESPLLKPALALGALAAVSIVAFAGVLAARLIRRSLAQRVPVAVPPEVLPPSFEAVESVIDSDPVAAYRSLAVIVRGFLAERFQLPANALTTSELRARMESSGADRFLARLVGGFLEECDSVVYAGYRPAAERRRADLTMAREIVEAGT